MVGRSKHRATAAHPLVVERLGVGSHAKLPVIGGVGLDQGYAGGVADALGVDIAELLDHLNVAGLERQHHRLG